MSLVKKIFFFASHFLSLFAIGAFTLGMSFLLNVWTDCPKGNDAGGHLFKVKVISQFWPHFNWTHSWAGGMPQFLKYPSLPYIPLALIHRQAGVNIGILLTAAGVAAVAISAIGIYLLVWELTRNRLVSLVSALIYSLTPASWSYAFSSGVYARAFASPFLVLALWSFVRFLKAKEEGKHDKIAFFLTAAFLALSTLNHYVVGFVAFGIVFLFGLFVIKDLREKFILPFKIFLPAALLTASFSLPFLVSRPTTRFLGTILGKFGNVPWSNLLYLFNKNIALAGLLDILSPFLIPLSIILLLAVFLFRRKYLTKDNFLFRTILFLLFLSLILLVYVKVIFGPLGPLYAIVGIPTGMLYYLAIVIAPLVGILLFLVSPPGRLKFLPSLILLLAIGLWIKFQFGSVLVNTGVDHLRPKCNYLTQSEKLEEIFSGFDQQFNFRLGLEDASIGAWFNFRFPYVPQTRDYFGQGVVDHDQRFYLIYSLFHQKDNLQETNFLMDWWGIKQFVVEKKSEVVEKYLSNPEYYRFLNTDKLNFEIFEFTKPSPILAGSNSLSILFIGKNDSYKIFFRDLASADLNSKHFIPAHNKEFIDDYTLTELRKFPVIVLYDYKYKQGDKAFNLLSSYLEGGGGIIIEAQAGEEKLLQILPVVGTEKKDFGKKWLLNQTPQGNEIFGEVDLSAFGPAVYDQGSWGVYVASETKDWGNSLLLEADRPILVAGEKGKGRIIWSGMNLPYHIDTYKSKEESILFSQLIKWVSGIEEKMADLPITNNSLTYETPFFKSVFIHPEKRIVVFKEETLGVLFKEFFFPNWQAYVNGQKVEIYKAGPEFMYVPGPFSPGDEVIFSYQLPFWPYKAGILVSVVTFLFLLVYLFKKEINFPKPSFLKRISWFFSQWWEKEGEG